MRSQPMPHPSSDGSFTVSASLARVGGGPAPQGGTEAGPSIPETLVAHLGPDAGVLPVTSTTWPPYEHVNVQGAVDTWLARHGAPYRLVGVTGFRHRMFGLSDLFHSEFQVILA